MARNRIKKIMLVCSALLLFLLLLESAFRLAGIAPKLPKAYADAIYIPDANLPYRPAPNITRNVLSGSGEFYETFTHNSAGFRDVEHALAKPDGVFRILALGDSFTYGAGAPFEETWLFLLETKLNARPGNHPKIEIIKAGVGGFFPEPERLLLEHFGIAYAPDLLIVGFNQSDVFETWQGANEIRVHDGFLKTAAARRMGKAGTFLYLHSHAARALFDLAQKACRARAMREFEADRGNAWQKIEAEYDRMLALLPAGARMAVVLIPFAHPPAFDDAARLQAYCESRGILFVNAIPELCVPPPPAGPLFWPLDGHCTPRGYAKIANLVRDAITQAEFVP